MDQQKLDRLAGEFVRALQTDTALHERVTRRKQQSAWAQEHLTREQIPTLSEPELLDFFRKLDHFVLVGSTKANFDRMIQNIGLDGLHNAFLNLVDCGEQGLSTDDLKRFFPLYLFHLIQISELMCLRFPHQYWIFNSSTANGTRRQLEQVGAVDPSDGVTNDHYTRVRRPMERVLETLPRSGVADADYGTVGYFLGWASRGPKPNGLDPDVEAARAQLEHLLPVAEVRHRCLSLLADSIELAHGSNGSGWSITRHSDHIRLNAGRLSAFTVSQGAIELTVETDVLDDQTRDELGDDLTPWTVWGRSYPSPLANARFPTDTLPLEVPPSLPRAHASLIEKASRLVARTPSFNAYSPGLLVYLREFLKRPQIPHPLYYDQRPPGPFDAMNTVATSLAQQGLHFTPWQIATFYTALQTKGIAILSGISGTGKTKLAQHFAEMLPQPANREPTMRDALATLTVGPSTLKYNQFVIPQKMTRLFNSLPPNAKFEVKVQFEGATTLCSISQFAGDGNPGMKFILSGSVRKWFHENLALGDQFTLDPQLDDEQNLTGFQLSKGIEPPEDSLQDDKLGSNLLFVPVRPDWRDSKSLLGYYNPLTSTYEWTDFLRFLQRAERSYKDGNGLAWFVIFDEMNLAHIEYYFADLLSVLESGRYEDGELKGLTREPLRFAYPEDAEGELPPRELRLPPNLYVVGTVNVDETTHAFSPKVLDRAFTLEFTDVDFANYPPQFTSEGTMSDAETAQRLLQAFTQNGTFERVNKNTIADFVAARPEVRTQLQNLNNLLKPHDLHFGYRVFDEIVTFLAAAEGNEMFVGENWMVEDEVGDYRAFDAAVLMKVLPKFHGSLGKLESPLRAVLAWCFNPDSPDTLKIDGALANIENADQATGSLNSLPFAHPMTAARTIRMLRALYTDGFAAFG